MNECLVVNKKIDFPLICLSIHLSFDHLFSSRSLSLAPLQYNKHLFVNISQSSLSYSDPMLESVDIRQIYDKFPEKKGGLKELFAKGPQNAFYLIKFWVSRQKQKQFSRQIIWPTSSH